VVLDVEATAPAYNLELLVLSGTDVSAVDANLGHAVTVLPAQGEQFPLSSGLTTLQVPADELVVGFSDMMPTVLAARTEEVPVALVRLENPAAEESGTIEVNQLEIHAADGAFVPRALGETVAEVRAYLDRELLASSGPLSAADTTALLVPAELLLVNPSQTRELELRLSMHEDVAVPSLRVGLDKQSISVLQPDGALLAIRIEPAEGSSFPFWTEAGNFTGMSLRESYSNFPNPFAAGKEQTTFVFHLPSEAKVTLRILTPHGENVATLLSRAKRAGGVYQEDTWDGRNGRGVTVRNGVYIAELKVAYADGKSERLLRKVAVVR
jgi:hypothetical protein